MAEQAPPARTETIGERLKRLRLERGLSQRELAAPGVSYAYISRIEAGTRQPSVKALRRLAGKLGVAAEYLETGSQLAPAGERELRLANLELAVRLGEWRDAEEPLQGLLADAEAAGDSDTALQARVELALVARERGDVPHMLELLEASTEEEPSAPVEHADLYLQLGYAYAASGKPELAVALFERCLAAARELGARPALEARFATALSRTLGEMGEAARAERLLREALERIDGPRDPLADVRLHWSLARAADAAGRPGLALANARRAVALLEATEDRAALARAHLLAASIGIGGGEPDSAAAHLDTAALLLGGAPGRAEEAALRVKRAQVSALRGEGAAAVALAREALAAIGEGAPEERGAALSALADGLALVGDDPAADDAYRQAVELFEGERRWREATQACRAWARMLRAAGREEQALDVLDRAAELGLRAAPAETRDR